MIYNGMAATRFTARWEILGGAGGEFLISGIAKFMEDEEKRETATRHASYEIISRYILFELGVDTAFSNVYGEDGKPIRNRWRRERD
jgi:hypothetical protein